METWADEPGRAPPYPQVLFDETVFPRDERVDLQHPLRREGCALYVTTHRVLVRCPGGERLAWPHSRLASVGLEKPGVLWDKSWKVVLREAGGGEAARLALPAGGHEALARALEAELAAWRERQAEAAKRRREMEAAAERAKRAPPPALLAPAAVSLAQAAAERKKLENEALAQAAFKSLDDLMAMGDDVARKVELYSAMLAAAAAKSGGGGGGGAPSAAPADAAESDALLGEILSEMGSVARPVNRENAGAREFAAALAAQFAAFIRRHVEKAGGLLPLTDAYCLYNRARGVDVVVPRDLLLAVGVLERSPSLGLRVRAMGGQRVLQLAELSDGAMAERVAAHLRAAAAAPGGAEAAFTSAVSLAAAARLPLPIAALQLQLAEDAGAVCRDVSLAGTRFYLADPFTQLAAAREEANDKNK